MKIRIPAYSLALIFFAVVFSSCIGLDTIINIQGNGSGSMDLVYTVSNTLDSMGKQDGNAGNIPLAASREDFEKTVSAIQGLSLKSYRTKKNDADTIISVRLDFSGPEALAAFFDASGQKLAYAEKDGKRELVFRLNDAFPGAGADEKAFFSQALSGYEYVLAVKTPGAMAVSFIDKNGNTVREAGVGKTELNNNGFSFRVPMDELVFAAEPVVVKITF